MISFKRIQVNEMPWDELNAFTGANIFHTKPWIDFLADFYKAEPVVATVQSDDQVVGYFTGLITKKLGLKILGSPFGEWNTSFMGFNLMPGVSYHRILQAFPKFAFEELKCHFLVIADVNMKGDEWEGLSYRIRKLDYYAMDLTKSEEELLQSMENRYVRRAIRRAINKGIVIEEATDPDFADEYYAQYQEVMARQSLTPLYGLDFVRQMIVHLLPTGHLLLLRARNHEGVCVATHIDFIFNKVAVGWGAATRQKYRSLDPNELVYWYVIKKMKSMGADVLHLAITKRRFKLKLGCYELHLFRLMKAAHPILFIPIFMIISLDARAKRIIRKVFG